MIEDNEERVFEIPGGRIGPSLLPFFNTAILLRMPVSEFAEAMERAYACLLADCGCSSVDI